MASYQTVEVSVEAVNECLIQEVTLDGQELYVQPLSMSENLTKLAHKIDFSKDESEEKGKPTSEGDTDQTEEEKTVTPFQPSLWPWDSVRTKLKGALTEVSVLLDVLNIAKEKRYMVLDPVSQEQPESRTGLHLLAKKRALAAAGNILKAGADRLSRSPLEVSMKRTGLDFHLELLRLRQNWRLKKVGNTILGDLSYKSAGSRFWQSGTFEVTKSDLEVNDPIDSPNQSPKSSSMVVSVPSELEGVAYIHLSIKHISDGTDLSSVELSSPNHISGSVPSDVHWQKKLEAAQNVIFCKEIFQQLAREAVQLKAQIPHMVVGNQIFSHIFPGIVLTIALCHYTDKDRRGQTQQQKPDHNHVLEHSLHQLLRQVHHRNTYHPMPHPVTALMGMSKRRRLAGPHAFSRTELLEMTQSETLLEQIVKQARHMILRQRTMAVVDSMAKDHPDPQVASHWSNISSALESQVKINITSPGHEIIRTPVVLHVGVDSIKAVCKDGRVLHLSNEQQELQDFLLCQIAFHHIVTVQNLAKVMGWQVLSANMHMGVGNMEPVGNPLSILLAAPGGKRVLSVRSGPVSGVRVAIQQCPRISSEGMSNAITDSKWSSLGGPFKPVHLDLMEGRNLSHKVELLMAALSQETD